MSNCIEFKNDTHQLSFNSSEFDVVKFMTDYNRELVDYMNDPEKGKDCGNVWYWFIFDTVSIGEDSNTGVKITFSLGKGNSTHTWRDFKWLMKELSQYIMRGKKVSFEIADEGDGFEAIDRVTILFKPGEVLI